MPNTGAEPATAEWRVVQTPFGEALHDVVQTVAGPHAVGASGTLVADTGDGWEVVLDDGPTASNNVLTAADVTDDGKRVWFLGGGGVLGCYDVETGRKHDYSFPKEMTTSWEAVTVSGTAGSEKALAANASGEVLPFVVNGFDVDWAPVTEPGGSGATIAALAASPNGVGYAVDHSGNAYGTKDEGWKVIGIVNAQVVLNDITAGAGGRVYVAGGDGRLYRYDDSYNAWTPIDVAGAALRAVGIDRERLVAVGANSALYQRDGNTRWREAKTPTDAALHDVALGGTDVAVGDHGVVLERPTRTSQGSGRTDSLSGSTKKSGRPETSSGAKKGGGTTNSGGAKRSGGTTDLGDTKQSGGFDESGGKERSGDTKKPDSSGKSDGTKKTEQSGGTNRSRKSETPTQPGGEQTSGGTEQTGGRKRGHEHERTRLERVRKEAAYVVGVADAARLAAGVDGLAVAVDDCGNEYLVVLD